MADRGDRGFTLRFRQIRAVVGNDWNFWRSGVFDLCELVAVQEFPFVQIGPRARVRPPGVEPPPRPAVRPVEGFRLAREEALRFGRRRRRPLDAQTHLRASSRQPQRAEPRETGALEKLPSADFRFHRNPRSGGFRLPPDSSRSISVQRRIPPRNRPAHLIGRVLMTVVKPGHRHLLHVRPASNHAAVFSHEHGAGV